MIAVRHNGQIALAADSRWATGWDVFQRVQPKVQRKGDVLFTVGPPSGLEHVIWSEVAALAATHDDWPERWATHVYSAADATATRRMATEMKETAVLVVWCGRIFEVYGGGGIFEPEGGLSAVGCGADYGRAAATIFRRQLKSARGVAERAVLIACELSAGCAPPVVCEVVPST